jgi:hypothetical protein
MVAVCLLSMVLLVATHLAEAWRMHQWIQWMLHWVQPWMQLWIKVALQLAKLPQCLRMMLEPAWLTRVKMMSLSM